MQNKNSRPQMFRKKEISQNSQESTCVRISFLINLQARDLKPTTLLRKRVWHRCYPVNFAKFLRTSFLTEHLCWMIIIRVIQNVYFKSEVQTLGENFLKFVCHLFSKLTLHQLFSLPCIYTIVQVVIENESQRSANESASYLCHVNTDLIMTMCLIWTQFCNYFSYIIFGNN